MLTQHTEPGPDLLPLEHAEAGNPITCIPAAHPGAAEAPVVPPAPADLVVEPEEPLPQADEVAESATPVLPPPLPPG